MIKSTFPADYGDKNVTDLQRRLLRKLLSWLSLIAKPTLFYIFNNKFNIGQNIT